MTQPMLVLSMVPGSGRFSRRTIPLDNAAFVGRSTKLQQKSFTNAFFESSVVSRKHGMFFYREGRFFYKDSHSLNGTWINEEKIEGGQEKQLQDGDIIQIGVDIHKILAKIMLTYPNVEDSVIPSSIAPFELELDDTIISQTAAGGGEVVQANFLMY